MRRRRSDSRYPVPSARDSSIRIRALLLVLENLTGARVDADFLRPFWGFDVERIAQPASACLSSRIEYGRRVTPEVLAQVEQAEDALAALGLRRFRVRHHGSVARVELAPEEMDAALNREMFRRIGAAVRGAGFQYAAIDCDGYRSGSMNEVLPLSVLQSSIK